MRVIEFKEFITMKIKLAALMLAALVSMQGAVQSQAADDKSAGDILLHGVTLPVRLVGGALTGTYGFLKGGVEESYDMSAEANDKVLDADASPAQVLIWPFTIPVGFVKGAVTGFGDKFPSGYTFIDGE